MDFKSFIKDKELSLKDWKTNSFTRKLIFFSEFIYTYSLP